MSFQAGQRVNNSKYCVDATSSPLASSCQQTLDSKFIKEIYGYFKFRCPSLEFVQAGMNEDPQAGKVLDETWREHQRTCVC
jgi:hypothetical protein